MSDGTDPRSEHLDAPASDADESEPEHLQSELGEVQAELKSLTDRHLRLAAEFDNYRKRVDRERAETAARAQADLIRALIEVLDDLQRVTSFTADGTTTDAVLEGVGLIEKKFLRKLEGLGLETLEPAGEFFNPEMMEAVATAPAEHPEEDDVVANVFQKGYRLRDILIRPARVQVKKYNG